MVSNGIASIRSSLVVAMIVGLSLPVLGADVSASLVLRGAKVITVDPGVPSATAIAVDGDKIVARIVLRGTHQGPFFGIPATGRQVVVPGIHLMRYADGKMVEHWSNSDDLGMMGQLGVIPTMG